jgi:hypothetical protein
MRISGKHIPGLLRHLTRFPEIISVKWLPQIRRLSAMNDPPKMADGRK